MGNLCCAREHSVQFFVQIFLHSSTAQFNLECIGPFKNKFKIVNVYFQGADETSKTYHISYFHV